MEYRVWGRVSHESAEERLVKTYQTLNGATNKADAECEATGLPHYVEQHDPEFGTSVLVYRADPPPPEEPAV